MSGHKCIRQECVTFLHIIIHINVIHEYICTYICCTFSNVDGSYRHCLLPNPCYVMYLKLNIIHAYSINYVNIAVAGVGSEFEMVQDHNYTCHNPSLKYCKEEELVDRIIVLEVSKLTIYQGLAIFFLQLDTVSFSCFLIKINTRTYKILVHVLPTSYVYTCIYTHVPNYFTKQH